MTFFLIIQNGTLLNVSLGSTCIFTTVSTENHQKRMAKKSAEKARKKRTTPTEPENQGKFQAVKAWFRTKMSSVKCKKREASESIEMAQRNRPTPASDEQPGRGQAIRDWFSSSFGRKAKGLILFVSFESNFFTH